MTVVSLVFIVLLLLNMPIAYVIGISSCLFFLLEPNVGFSIAAQKMVVSTQSFTFLSVPFFLTAGCIMNAAGITDRLVNFAKTLTGHLVGGLACSLTMYFTVYRPLGRLPDRPPENI